VSSIQTVDAEVRGFCDRPTKLTSHSVYTAFFADLERRIEQGENPTCFARGMADLGMKYGFDKAQTYFAGREEESTC
jgi:hypothetical protein